MLDIDSTNLERKMNGIMDKWGEVLKQEMKIRCPKEYGNMVASIDIDTIKPFDEKSGGEVGVGTHNINYASHVEYGTPNAAFPIVVGTPEEPRTEWTALLKRGEIGSGQTMPFARSSDFFTEEERMNVLKEAFH